MSWIDLLQGDKPGLIHVDYCFSANGSVDSLKLWLSTVRGHWHLVCEYGMTVSTYHPTVVRFEQGYQSAELVRNLKFIMRHQDRLQLALNHGCHGLLLVCAPTRQETETASAAIAWRIGR